MRIWSGFDEYVTLSPLSLPASSPMLGNPVLLLGRAHLPRLKHRSAGTTYLANWVVFCVFGPPCDILSRLQILRREYLKFSLSLCCGVSFGYSGGNGVARAVDFRSLETGRSRVGDLSFPSLLLFTFPKCDLCFTPVDKFAVARLVSSSQPSVFCSLLSL